MLWSTKEAEKKEHYILIVCYIFLFTVFGSFTCFCEPELPSGVTSNTTLIPLSPPFCCSYQIYFYIVCAKQSNYKHIVLYKCILKPVEKRICIILSFIIVYTFTLFFSYGFEFICEFTCFQSKELL